MKRIQKILFLLLFFAGSSRAVTYPFSIIDTPGFYKLASNVTTNQITIAASDVTLNMNGGTVSGGTNGIVINSGLNNVTIKDGMVTSVSSDGIQVGAGCTDITLKGIAISQAHVALNCEQVTNALIRDCDFNQSTTGLQLDTCQNIVLQNCTANANTHAGYDLISSTTCSVLECRAVSTGEGNSDIDSTTVFGFVSANGNGNLFENCIANATMALSVTGSSSLIAGFALRGDESCTKIINSESSNTETNVNGFTVPYGILLEATLDSTQNITGQIQHVDESSQVNGLAWSPDGQYLAMCSFRNDGAALLYRFDAIQESLTLIGLFEDATTPLFVEWDSSGRYIAMAGSFSDQGDFVIYEFDNRTNALNIVADALGSSGFAFGVSWAPSGNYLAMASSGRDGMDFNVVAFDRVDGTTTEIASALVGEVHTAHWDPSEKYIAVGGEDITTDGVTGINELLIYSFDPFAESLTLLDSDLDGIGVWTVNWSPDGQYLAVGGDTLEGGSNLIIYSFDRESESLDPVADMISSGTVYSARWSSDGNYVAIGGHTIVGGTDDPYQIIRFDRGAGTLEAITGALTGAILFIDWSPNGEYIAIPGADLGGTGDNLQIFTGLTFPQNNVIQNNTIYCNSGAQFPSGIGISGSSISNLIIQNNAFNNPIPRAANKPIVSTNYAFVTNVFDQLFGEGPAVTQNIATAALTPQITVPDVPARIKRTELLLESLIDNLL